MALTLIIHTLYTTSPFLSGERSKSIVFYSMYSLFRSIRTQMEILSIHMYPSASIRQAAIRV